MRRVMFGTAMLATALTIAACGKDATSPSTATIANQDDYALVVFGTAGTALENTMGPPPVTGAFDGRSGAPHLPDSLALTDAQKAQIDSLRSAFQAAHQAQLDQLKAIFGQARAAHQAGATRDSVRAILQQAKAIHDALQSAVQALHDAIQGVLTDAQRAWIEAHRPPPPPDVNGRQQGPGGPGRRRPPPPIGG